MMNVFLKNGWAWSPERLALVAANTCLRGAGASRAWRRSIWIVDPFILKVRGGVEETGG